jgi:hypothetical protein
MRESNRQQIPDVLRGWANAVAPKRAISAVRQLDRIGRDAKRASVSMDKLVQS